MASRIIYQSPANANTPGAGWTVTQDPTFSGNPNLVRFHRSNGQRNLLDQIAEWVSTPDEIGGGWNRKRWVPRPPMVPAWLLDKVHTHMRSPNHEIPQHQPRRSGDPAVA